MNTKICTSIEQSKKLLSLGLDQSTADMFYEYIGFEERLYAENPILRKSSHFDYTRDIPAWSLTALLELMPLSIKTNKGNYYFSLVRGCAGAYTFTYIHGIKEPIELGYNLHLTTHENYVIDAAFEMVCWLIEQGHIKVNK